MEIIQYNDDFVTKLFFVVDELVQLIHIPILSSSEKGKKRYLRDSELITIQLLFSLSNCNDFKHFTEFFDIGKYFKHRLEYSRLLRNVKGVLPVAARLLQRILSMNRANAGEVKLIDSMPLPVCSNKRIFGYKVSSEAGRGKSSMGWYYGFKMHLITDVGGNILRMHITGGNISDRNYALVTKLCEELTGVIVGDAGYDSVKIRKALIEKGLAYITGTKKTTKKLVAKGYHELKKLRQMIEVVNGCIKYRRGCASSLPRSTDGYMMRYMGAVLSYAIIKAFF